MTVAALLLRGDVQACLKEKGFTGLDVLTKIRTFSIEDGHGKTTYSLTVDRYRILPADGFALEETKKLIITSAEINSRAGRDLSISCSYLPLNK